MIPSLRTYIISCILLAVFSASGQDCFISERITIIAEDTTTLRLDVDGLINDDLATNQSICGIRMFFAHGQVGNLRMTLISPDNQEVTLLGPGRNSSGLTQLVNWNIIFSPCATPAVPDSGFDPVWDNDQPWQSLSTYNGIYHPHNGCLEDFNSGSANGTWQLQIENLGPLEGRIEYFEIIFCDNTGISCVPCVIDAGSLDSDFYTTCQQDLTLRNLSNLVISNYAPVADQEYQYILSESDNILAIDPDLNDLDTLSPGFYTICGMAYQISDEPSLLTQTNLSDIRSSIESNQVCADLTAPCFSLQISPVDHIVEVDTTFCVGDTISFLGIKIFDDLDTNILRANQVACDSLIIISAQQIEVNSILSASLDTVICGEPILINGNSSTSTLPSIDYDWSTVDGNFISDVGPVTQVDKGGTYRLDIESGGCMDSAFITIYERDTFSAALVYDTAYCVDQPMTLYWQSELSLDSVFVSTINTIVPAVDSFITQQEDFYTVEMYSGSCRRIDSIGLERQTTPIDIQVSTSIIDCDNTLSTVVVSSNVIIENYEYSGPENITETDNMISVSTAGDYSVVVTDNNGCTAMQSFTVEESQDLPEYLTMDMEISCMRDTVTLPLSVLSVIDSVRWSGPDNFSSNEINPAVSDNGVYYFQIFGSNGCIKSDSLVLGRENVVPNFVEIGGGVDCDQEIVFSVYEHNADRIQWTFNGDIISDQDSLVIEESGTYHIEFFSGFSCYGIDSVTYSNVNEYFFTINNIPDTLALSCQVDSVLVSPEFSISQSNIDLQWLLGGQEISILPDLIIKEEGRYIINACNTCCISDTIDVIRQAAAFDIDNIQLQILDAPCAQDSSFLLISGVPVSDSIDFIFNQQPIEQTTELYLPSGPYSLLIEDNNGCQFAFDSTAIYPDELTLDLGDDLTGLRGEQLQVSISTNLLQDQIRDWMWSDESVLDCTSCFDPVVTIENDTILELILTDENGCMVSDNLFISVIEPEDNTDVYIPNIFFPESDTDNNALRIYHGDGISRIYDIRIFDRWGNLLFFRKEYRDIDNFIWDGSFEGEDLDAGVYVLKLNVTTTTNTEKEIIRAISLLR